MIHITVNTNLKYEWSLMTQCKPRGEIVMTDKGNEFYLLQFTIEQDYNRVLFEGSWMVADHVLIEYYDASILMRVAKLMGRPIKVDDVTLHSTRVKYAPVCVEVDLTKPLLSKFKLQRKVWRIVYEGLSMVCFMCGREPACVGSEPRALDDCFEVEAWGTPHGI
ncbi:hypothetical protein Tsubulata_008951 [Turnera subulata]|uniref:DUF4283 domain-containing protein n=1 Tax=Turnera subulata TaxID=218843 RepID=A0A9Q0FR34_9ROSI|nr:hypothetical protein Tsubulata_008951 [Turnera subulata]